jgi:hypothetical protein
MQFDPEISAREKEQEDPKMMMEMRYSAQATSLLWRKFFFVVGRKGGWMDWMDFMQI